MVLPDMTNEKFTGSLLCLDQAIMAQANRYVGLTMNFLESTMTFRLTDFVRKNPLLFMTLRREIIPKIFYMVFIRF